MQKDIEDINLRSDSEARAADGSLPPPPPRLCSGSNIFDGLASGSLLLFFCLMSWTHGSNAFGNYAFFRGSAIGGSILAIFTLAAFCAVAGALWLLALRVRHGRYCRLHYPKPKKEKGPSVWADMKDALDQMLGLKPHEGMPEDQGPPKKRILRNWFWQEKTRIGLSSGILALLLYMTPGFIIHLMGMHAILLYLLMFMSTVTTFTMWLIAWVELGE